MRAHNKQLVKKYANISLAIGVVFLLFAAAHYQWYRSGLDEATKEIIEDLEDQQ